MSSNSSDKELLSIHQYGLAIMLLSQTTLMSQWHFLTCFSFLVLLYFSGG